MKHLKHSIITILFLFPCITLAHIPTAINGKSIPSLAPMLKKVTPAVVNIVVDKKIPLAKQQEFMQASKQKAPLHAITVGSGVIIDAKQGLIVTNAHVVSDAKFMLVTLKDGRRFRPKLVGKDDGFDIAILRIHATNLTSIPFADSNKLQVGNFVAAIGSPFGLTQTVTSGVISALNRSEPKIEGFQSFIQTDAPINPGNSGGALLNLQGQLVGINTAIITPVYGNIGIGFAIPSNMVHSVVMQLLKYGKVKRGMLGVIGQNISPDLASALHIKVGQGVLVTKVVPGSPAEKSGLQVRDIIKEVNTKQVNNAVQLRNMLGILRPGTALRIVIDRHHQPQTLLATVGNPKMMLKQHRLSFISGLRLRNFSELESDGSQLQGALVVRVSETSESALAGLIPGDVITSANSQTVTSVKQLETIATKPSKQLLLTVARGNSRLFLVIEPR